MESKLDKKHLEILSRTLTNSQKSSDLVIVVVGNTDEDIPIAEIVQGNGGEMLALSSKLAGDIRKETVKQAAIANKPEDKKLINSLLKNAEELYFGKDQNLIKDLIEKILGGN